MLLSGKPVNHANSRFVSIILVSPCYGLSFIFCMPSNFLADVRQCKIHTVV